MSPAYPPSPSTPTMEMKRQGSYGLLSQADDFNIAPISSLPTPPMATDESPAPSRRGSSESEIISFAPHLANLVPTNCCRSHPSTATISSYLGLSDLPAEIVGLAACILDALSTRFARSWRAAITEGGDWNISPLRQSVTSSAGPELIVLSALALAASYLHDKYATALRWAQDMSQGSYSNKIINTTIRTILQDVNYDLHGFTPDMIDEAVGDCRRAAQRAQRKRSKIATATATTAETEKLKLQISLNDATDVQYGLLTPAASP